MSKFTALQRAELRDAYARSRINAENELIKLRKAAATRSRTRREHPHQPAPLTHYIPDPPPIRHHEQLTCIYCGHPCRGGACPAHNDLLTLDIPAGAGL